MKLIPFVLSMLFFTLLFSCGAEKNENEVLKEQVIAIHDEVMPEIGHLKNQQSKLIEKANSLENETSATSYRRELNLAAQSCESAYDNMFVWMRQFKSEYDDMSEEETSAYLKEQLQMVEKVKADILTARSTADSLLNVSI